MELCFHKYRFTPNFHSSKKDRANKALFLSITILEGIKDSPEIEAPGRCRVTFKSQAWNRYAFRVECWNFCPGQIKSLWAAGAA